MAKTTVEKNSNRRLAPRVIARALRNTVSDWDQVRYHGIRELWSTVKRVGTEAVLNVEVREIPCVQDARIESFADDRNRAVIAAICQGVGAKTFFEIGTNRGRTAWTVARNNPDIQVHTIDLSEGGITDAALHVNEADKSYFIKDWDRGEAFAETEEAERIEQLWGDSATYDFSPYHGKMDVVLIDGAHSYEYLKNDTEVALAMLTPAGAIIWDDYPSIPGVYECVNEVAPTLDQQPFHILGTRMVVYSRTPLLQKLEGSYGMLYQA